ncbi:nuclear transport factor 2 family protein [Microbacterium betulae]|uniref:Nuclear transport factor 2 family protein n=1 Tax=Microbacterium betulae TaxID=2981139 RepID=A0AA97FGT1_9MICO|nr:nuclear transport factor 2 family protein [Microbacterium sp. AB]WOF21819.1 nuclear transport factor 2 family protein [Microbacterium sp. AB]
MGSQPDQELTRSLEPLFAAENARDWQRYATFLHPEVVWTLVDGADERRIVGREEYLAVIRRAYEGVSTRFRCVDMMIDEGRARVASLLISDTGDRSLDVFDLEDGLIRREWEFFLGRE